MYASNKPISRSLDIWRNIKSVNADATQQRQAVGRITIVREPSPLLFAALHHTMREHFDVDEMFQLLVDDKTKAVPHRPFSPNPTHRRTFVFSLDYFTIIGDECVPMSWQKADQTQSETESHIPISRCSSVVALYLGGETVSKIRNRARRIDRKIGDVYDPFSPYVLFPNQMIMPVNVRGTTMRHGRGLENCSIFLLDFT